MKKFTTERLARLKAMRAEIKQFFASLSPEEKAEYKARQTEIADAWSDCDGDGLLDIPIELARSISDMKDSGLPVEFCNQIQSLAIQNEGVADLVHLWGATTSQAQCDLIVQDLNQLLKDSKVPIKSPSE